MLFIKSFCFSEEESGERDRARGDREREEKQCIMRSDQVTSIIIAEAC